MRKYADGSTGLPEAVTGRLLSSCSPLSHWGFRAVSHATGAVARKLDQRGSCLSPRTDPTNAITAHARSATHAARETPGRISAATSTKPSTDRNANTAIPLRVAERTVLARRSRYAATAQRALMPRNPAL